MSANIFRPKLTKLLRHFNYPSEVEPVKEKD